MVRRSKVRHEKKRREKRHHEQRTTNNEHSQMQTMNVIEQVQKMVSGWLSQQIEIQIIRLVMIEEKRALIIRKRKKTVFFPIISNCSVDDCEGD